MESGPVCAAERSPPPESFIITCYVVSALVLVTFGALAVWLSAKMPQSTKDIGTFITARKTQPWYRMAWSFYASAIGAWAVFLPASYTSFGGWVSILTYAMATGLPLLLAAEWGAIILRSCPDALSLNDFAKRRYGKSVQVFVIILTLVNMCVCLVAEFTAIGDLFHFYVGGERMGVIIFVGLVTALYTATGGLLVSIITDQAQAILSLLLMFVGICYLAATFRCELPSELPPNLDVNEAGLSSIWSLVISLISSTIYSEAFWQRVWAAQDPKALRTGAAMGFGLTFIVITFFGFVGFLGLWAGMPPLDDYNNLAFFVPFTGTGKDSLWIRVVLVVLTATMCESGVDSLQNAIVATLSSSFMMDKPVTYTRIMVFLINAPLMAIAIQGYSLLDIFLIINVITVCCTFPILSGLWLPAVSGITVLFSSAFGMFWTCVFGCLFIGDFKQGMIWTFSSTLNFYDYRLFLVGFFSSIIGVMIGWAAWDGGLSGRVHSNLLKMEAVGPKDSQFAADKEGAGGDVHITAAVHA